MKIRDDSVWIPISYLDFVEGICWICYHESQLAILILERVYDGFDIMNLNWLFGEGICWIRYDESPLAIWRGYMTAFIHKCELLDICSFKVGQADRQRNKPKYGGSESHILPTACLYLMWGCADMSFVVKQKSNTEIQRSG